jgi:spermidine synthase
VSRAPDDGERWVELARAEGVLGEVVLRRRGTPAGPLVDLVVAGVAVMDDRETTSERALATLALDELARLGTAGAAPHLVVGGLGLGFTAAALLADPRLGPHGRITVVEVEPAVVAWNRAGLVPATAGALHDPRLEVVVGDVTEVLPALAASAPGSADAVLLDVDNGPGFLVVPANARLYEAEALAGIAALLRPGGVAAVWSAQPAPQLRDALAAAVGSTRVHRSSVVREGRDLDYYVHLAARRA